MTQQFSDQSALVTGAGSGMGAATAILLAERGATVTLVGRRHAKLEEVAGEIRRAGGRAPVHEGDVSDPRTYGAPSSRPWRCSEGFTSRQQCRRLADIPLADF